MHELKRISRKAKSLRSLANVIASLLFRHDAAPNLRKNRYCWLVQFAALLLLGFATFKDVEPVEKFKVVDQYQGCEVIRYTDPTNRWNYLLKCT
jgi:hypothetical protein